MSKEIPFQSTKIQELNFTVRKKRNADYQSIKSNTSKNIFDKFDDEFKELIMEDQKISLKNNGSIINSKYSFGKSKVIIFVHFLKESETNLK